MKRWPLAVTLVAAVACGGGNGEDATGALVVDEVAVTTFLGALPGDSLGASVTGDFNADGRVDIAIAATGGDGPQGDRSNAGKVHVLLDFVSLAGVVDLASPDVSFTVYHGPFPEASLGRSLTSGDYNADGIDDLVMAAPLGIDPATGIESPGLIYVSYGGLDWTRGAVDLATAPADVVTRGEDPGDGAGLALATGDIDADGADDLVVGAHLADGPSNSRPDAGEAYLVSGLTLANGTSLASIARSVVFGANQGDHLSEQAVIGDFTADNRKGAAIAATFEDDQGQADSGVTYIFDPLPQGIIDLAVGRATLRLGGADAGDQLGHSIGVGSAGPEGQVELWLGAVSADGPDNAEDLAGEARLFNLLGSNASTTMYGPGTGARLGRSAATAHFDGDGNLDLAIAATDVLERRGQVSIIPGNSALPERSDSAPVVFQGVRPDDILGHEAFGQPSLTGFDMDAGSVGGLLVAAPGYDGPEGDRTDCGAIYLLRASLP
jgi:hypothetical protein